MGSAAPAGTAVTSPDAPRAARLSRNPRMRQAIVPGMTMLPARREHLMDVSPGRRAGSLSGAGPARMVGCPACRKPLEFYSPQKCR
jgi:hypothetical protein